MRKVGLALGLAVILPLFLCSSAWGQAQVPLLIHVNFLVVDDGVTDLAANAIFAGPGGAVGEVDPILPQIFDLNILIILNQIYSQCNISFQLETVKVVRPTQVSSPLRSGKTMDELFVGEGKGRTLELDAFPSFLDELVLMILPQRGEDPFGLYREGAYLTIFVVGAPLTEDGSPSALAVGQLNGRHSVATYRNFVDINNPVSVETIAHEWGHNLGLLHTDEDSFEDNDEDVGNLMYAGVNPSGRGNRRLTKEQCELARRSPLLVSQPQATGLEINVPQDFPTIQTALAAAPAGATVRLAAGVYDESVFIDKPLRLVAQEGANVVLRGDPENTLEALNIDSASGVIVEGLTISNKGIFVRNSLDVVFKNNRVRNNSDGVVVFNSRVRLENNVISDNTVGVALVDAVDCLIQGNTITNNVGEFGAGLLLQGAVAIQIQGNVIGNNSDGIVMLFDSEAAITDNHILNNDNFGIFLDESSQISQCSGNQITSNALSRGVPSSCDH